MNATNTGDAGRSPHADIAARLIDGRSWASDPAVSPDGRRVACVVATTALEHTTTRTRVGLDRSPVTAGDKDANPTWSPDGRQLAFTSRRGEKETETTLHVMPVAAPGEVRTICTMPESIDSVSWSPDGRWLAFVSRTRDERYAAKDASWQAPRKMERFFGRLNGEDWIFDRPAHVYAVPADGTGPPRNLTPGEHQHDDTAWTADSSAVITSAGRHATWDSDFAVDLYACPLAADEAPRKLTATDGIYSAPAVSPDGTRVALVGFDDPSIYPQNARLGIIATTASDTPVADIVWASADLDRTLEATAGTVTPIWQDDRTILFVAEDRGATHAYRVAADGSTPPEQVTTGASTVTGLSAAGGTIASTRTTVDRPADLWVGERQVTHVGDSIAPHVLPTERFTVPTTDGTDEIDCWIVRPKGFEEGRTYPVLLNVHGGPFTQYGEYFFDEVQMQAAAGFVAVYGNPRGGSGRDTAWGQAILGPKHPVRPGSGWGTVDVDDVLAIIDGALDRFPFCDPQRVGMLGGSYGGYMASWLAAHHGDRFRAICSERAVNNLLSFEWSSDIVTAFRTEHGLTHVEDPEEYLQRSPITYVDRIETPMLLIHSEEDWRCPIVQAEELWVALKLRGKEVDFYRFPGENHELSRSGSPIHRVQRGEIILDWFTDRLSD